MGLLNSFFVFVIDVSSQWVVCMEGNLLKITWKEVVPVPQDIRQQRGGSSYMS